MAIKDSLLSNSSFKEGSQTCYSLKFSMNSKASIFRIDQALVGIVAFQRSHNALQWGQNPSEIALKLLKLSACNLLIQHLSMLQQKQIYYGSSNTGKHHLLISLKHCYSLGHLKSEYMPGQCVCLFVCNRGDTILCSQQSSTNKRKLG